MTSQGKVLVKAWQMFSNLRPSELRSSSGVALRFRSETSSLSPSVFWSKETSHHQQQQQQQKGTKSIKKRENENQFLFPLDLHSTEKNIFKKKSGALNTLPRGLHDLSRVGRSFCCRLSWNHQRSSESGPEPVPKIFKTPGFFGWKTNNKLQNCNDLSACFFLQEPYYTHITLPPIIMVQWKMSVSPILVSFHLGWFSTETMIYDLHWNHDTMIQWLWEVFWVYFLLISTNGRWSQHLSKIWAFKPRDGCLSCFASQKSWRQLALQLGEKKMPNSRIPFNPWNPGCLMTGSLKWFYYNSI